MDNKAKKIEMKDLVDYCNNYGFIFQGSEIYGGLANTWDYGPLGSRLKNTIKDAWRYFFIQKRDNAYEVDADILMNPRVWEASGHVHIKEHNVPCPNCGKSNFTDIRQFNLMFATQRGVTNDSANTVYLRPENAQGEYVNFLNVLRTTRTKLPFSIGQIGKAFRNEITPGNFTFRTIEFEQMEFQTFCKHGDDEDIYEYFKNYGIEFFNMLGLPKEKLRHHDHEKLAHYAKAACDIEYLFPFGWGEINGTHNRTDFDLSRHAEFSGKKQEYCDQTTGEKFTPYIIESTYGLDRITLAVLFEAYTIEELENGDTRELLKISPALAPIKLNICPIKKKFHSEKAKEILAMCKKHFMTSYDESGSIGKRYRRADAIGTPWQISVDEKTVEENIVTLRDRDTMEQIELKVEELVPYIEERIQFEK